MVTKFFIVLMYFLVGSGVRCHIDDAVKQEVFNIYRGITVGVEKVTHTKVTPDEITYTYFTNNGPQNGTIITSSNMDIIESRTDKLIFILHGWISSATADWVLNLKNAFLISYPNCSVVTVDWEKPAAQPYSISSSNTVDIGDIAGEFIIDLIDKYKIGIEKFILVGHSLGSHTCGIIGRKLKSAGKLLPRIVALDPAGPLFPPRPKDAKLDPLDAEVVEVLHTDSAKFGLSTSCGTLDFYANGGQFQPGCARIDVFDLLNIDPVMCDHRRAHAYFIEAILNPTDFWAKKCSTYNPLYEHCDENITIPLGDLTTVARGNFYFDTNKEPPYAKREKTKGGILGIASKLFKH